MDWWAAGVAGIGWSSALESRDIDHDHRLTSTQMPSDKPEEHIKKAQRWVYGVAVDASATDKTVSETGYIPTCARSYDNVTAPAL